MADTVLRFNVEAGKDFFHVYDKTGSYDKKNNQKGWGSPNSELTDVTGAIVRIYLPEESTTYYEVSVYPNLPNTDCIGYEIIPSDIGLDDFPPGVYRFEYIVTMYNGRILSQTCYTFFYQALECCISKKKAKISPLDASSDESLKVIELEVLLENAKYCACSGKMDCAQEISEYIWINCGCCC